MRYNIDMQRKTNDSPEKIAHDVQRRIQAGETLEGILAADAEQARGLGFEIDVAPLQRTIEAWIAEYPLYRC